MTTTTSTSRRSSSSRVVDRLGVAIRCSRRADGDFHPTTNSHGEAAARRRALVDLPWTILDQRHGTEVVRVEEPGGGDGRRGDIVITDLPDTVLGCWVGDCAPVVLIGARRQFAVVHAGWRGLAAGVIDRAVEAFSEPVRAAVLGPTIGVCCYEFGAVDLEAVAAGVHASPTSIVGTTVHGTSGLDVPAAVSAACRAHDVALTTTGGCTGCMFDGFSHRVRRDTQRHVVAAWRPDAS